MKKIILLSVLVVLCLPSFGVFASTGNYSFNWTMCNALIARGNLEIQGNIGVPYVVISWALPAFSFENNGGCAKNWLTGMEITTIVTANGYQSVPTSSSPSVPSGSITLPLEVRVCAYHYGCSNPTPYHPKYGDYVTVSLTAIYNVNDHGTTDTLKITS